MATFDDLVEQGNDILAADALVDAATHYKLPSWLRAQMSAAVASAGVRQDERGLAEGTRRAASPKARDAPPRPT